MGDDHNTPVAEYFPEGSSNDLKLIRDDNLKRVLIRFKGIEVRVDRRLTGQQTGDHFAVI